VSALDLPEPPAGSRAHVEEGPEGVRLILDKREFRDDSWGWLRILIAFLLLTLLFGAGLFGVLPWVLNPAQVGRSDNVPILFWTVFWPGLCWLGGLAWALVHLARCRTGATLLVAQGGLRVRIVGPLTDHEWHWLPGQIDLIRVVKGLCIYRNGLREAQLLPDRERRLLLWVARVLRKALGSIEGAGAAPDELTVTYDGPEVHGPLRGYLQAISGQLRLRDPFAEREPLRFLARTEEPLLPWWPGRQKRSVLRVRPQDITCRVGNDGATCLQIAVEERFDEFLIWCDDAAALPRALERFWGGQDTIVTHQ
jgi:hypothetical protein